MSRPCAPQAPEGHCSEARGGVKGIGWVRCSGTKNLVEVVEKRIVKIVEQWENEMGLKS